MADGPLAEAAADGQGVLIISNHLVGRETDAPLVQQRLQSGGSAGGHHGLGIGAGRRHIDLCQGIHKDERVAAAQDELVDGVQGAVGQVLWLHQPEQIDLGIDLGQRRVEVADFK